MRQTIHYSLLFFFLSFSLYSYSNNGIELSKLNSDYTAKSALPCNAPDWLATVNISQTTATWDWSSASGAVSYSVQWRYAGGTWSNLSGGPWTNTLLNVGGLQSGTAYEWRVRSNCPNGMYSEWSYASAFTTLTYSCSPPVNLSTTNITDSTAIFNWSAVPGAQSYAVQIRLQNGLWANLPGSPFASTSVTAHNLIPNTAYVWRVKTNCSGGQSSNWCAEKSFTTTGLSSCDAPGVLSTTNITQTSARFTWSPVSGAVSYSIQYRLAGGTWHNLAGGPWTVTTLNLVGFQSASAYEWRVRSNCPNGMYSDYSYAESFTTLGSYNCATPSNPSTSNVTDSTATFSWTSVPGAVSYSVEIRLPNGIWASIPGSPLTSTSVTVHNLNSSTAYQWRVRTNCSGGQYSCYTYPVCFTTTGISSCDAPDSLVTYNITNNRATFDWSPVAGAISYSVQYRVAGGVWHDLYGGPWTSTKLNLIGFQPGTAYEWRVRSNCQNGGSSEWSVPAIFTTLDCSCGIPNGTFTSYITNTSATFNWLAVAGAQSYSVQIRLPNGTWSTVSGSPFNSTSITINNLTPNTTYHWRVRANCSGGQSGLWTCDVSFTTGGSSSCATPGNLVTLDISTCTATFDWSTVPGAVSYSLQWRYPGGSWHNLGSTCGNSIVHLIGFNSCTTYEWRVKSNCPNGMMSEWSSPASFTTLCNSCSVPGNPLTTNITATGAKLNWIPVSGAQSYSVQKRLANGTWYDVQGSPFMNPPVFLTGLSSNTTYEWRIRTNCANGQFSTWTAPISFTTSGSVQGDVPLGLAVNNNTPVVLDAGDVTGSVQRDNLGNDHFEDITSHLQITPNPANDVLHISFMQTKDSRVTGIILSDLSGQIVLREKFERRETDEFSAEINVNHLVSGMYILQVMTSTGIQTERVMVTH